VNNLVLKYSVVILFRMQVPDMADACLCANKDLFTVSVFMVARDSCNFTARVLCGHFVGSTLLLYGIRSHWTITTQHRSALQVVVSSCFVLLNT
jgi:hypothetical protein